MVEKGTIPPQITNRIRRREAAKAQPSRQIVQTNLETGSVDRDPAGGNGNSGPSLPVAVIPVRKLDKRDPADVKPVDRADLVAKVGPSIVQIQTDTGLGSGFVIHESGLIVTNYHVIENAENGDSRFSAMARRWRSRAMWP